MLAPDSNPLVGRADAVARVLADLSRARLVTLTGPAGIGKSRVARAAAAACELPVVAVELGSAAGEDELVARVAEALGVALASRQAAGAVGDALAGRGDLLLLMDPFEALVEAAPVLAAWLATAPGLRLLVASRVRLRLALERVHPLGPLREALELFAERARAVRPDFVVDDEARALVARLDGLPLAIEFAAARAALVGARALLERLDLEHLATDRRDVPARQATLRGALEGSWRLMTPTEQAALVALSSFCGAFDLNAAEQILGDGGMDLLTALVDQSLVQVLPGTPRRYRLLAVIRAWAQARGGETASAGHASHARWFLAEGRRRRAQVHGFGGAEAASWLASAREDLLAVRARFPDAAEEVLWILDPVLATRGPFEEHARWLDEAIAKGPSARAFLLRGALRRRRGDLDASVEDLERAASDAQVGAEATAELGIALHERGDLDAAEAAHARARVLFAASQDARGEARVLGSQAILAHERGEADDAQIAYEQALTVLRRAGDSRSEAILLSNLGDLHLEQGRPAEARARYERAHALLTALGDARVAGIVRGNLGAVALDEGRAELAVTLRAEAVAAMRRVGDGRMEAVFRGYEGAALHALGQREAAREAYDDAVAALDGRFGALFASHRAALDVEGGGNLAAAEAALARAAQAADPALAAVVATYRGLCAARRGDRVAAGECLDAPAPPSDDLRFARRRLAVALAAEPPAAPTMPLSVSATGARLPDGTVVDLSRRPTLARVLAGLALRRREAPGDPMDLSALLAAGWPGEQVVPQAAANRVYVAIATLRKLGLRDLILSREDGYLLDPQVPLE